MIMFLIFIIYISFRKIALDNSYNGNGFLRSFLNIPYYRLYTTL